MQNKNVWLFLVLSLFILFGSQWLYLWLYPPPPRKPKPPTQLAETEAKGWPFAGRSKKTQDQAIASLSVATLAGLGLDQPARLATEVAVLSQHLPQPDPWPWTRRERPVQQAVAAQLTALAPVAGTGLDQAARVAAEVAQLTVHPPVPRKVEAPLQEITLGDDQNFFLKVRLSSRGGSVRQVVLNRFPAADMYGLPVWKDRNSKTPQPLELVPDRRIRERPELEKAPDHEIVYDNQSPLYHYQLYHYANPDDESQDARPEGTLGAVNWTLTQQQRSGDEHLAAFTYELPGKVRITKTYRLAKGWYHVSLSVKVENLGGEGGERRKFRYQLAGAHGLPIEGAWYTYTYRNAMIGWTDPKGGVRRHLEDNRMIAHAHGSERVDKRENVIRYAAVAVQFFAAAVAVAERDQQASGRDDFVQWVRATREGQPHPQKEFLDDITVRLITEAFPLDKPVEHNYVLYHGPVKVNLLHYLKGDDAVEESLVARYRDRLQLRTLTDYPSPGFFGSVGNAIYMTDLIIFFTNLMHWLLDKLHLLVPIFGLNIIMLTVIVRGLMFPVSRRQALANQKMQEKMAKLAPEVKKLQEKYKDDPLALNQARNQLYLQHGINPLTAMGGCLLIFAQMPIFLGLYYCLQESIFFRLDNFLWMPNLAAPDMLFWWGEHLWFISEPANLGTLFYLGPYFNLLPIIAVGLMLVQQKMMMPAAPMDEQQEMQMKMMKWMMIMFGFMFYKVAAGLCIYFIASSVWGLTERKLLPKAQPAAAAGGPPEDTSRPRPDSRRPKAEAKRDKEPAGFLQRLNEWWQEVLKEAAKQQQARREDRGGKKAPRR